MHTVDPSTILGTIISMYNVESSNVLQSTLSSPAPEPNSKAGTCGICIGTVKSLKCDVICTYYRVSLFVYVTTHYILHGIYFLLLIIRFNL